MNKILDWTLIEHNKQNFTIRFDVMGDSDKIRHDLNRLINAYKENLEDAKE